MERKSVSDLIKELEPLLKKFENDDGLKITHAGEEPGCKAGDNYMSVVMQTTVNGTRGNGTTYSESFMTKYLPHHREITTIFRTGDLFKNESYAYDKLLPLLGDFGPICVHADDDKIIMQDLKPLGYSVLDRRELLDFDHCVATVQILARLHASSLSLKLKDTPGFLELMKPLQEVLFPRETKQALGASVEDGVKRAIEHLEWIEPKSKELEEGIKFLKSCEGKVYSDMQDLVDPGKGKYHVIAHGDCWNNNIMFKHNAEGKILDVKLIDFQVTRHASPAIDFHYFMCSSPKSSVIEENYEDLVKAYHSTFVKTLSEGSGISQELIKQFDLQWFKTELKNHSKYGIFTGCWIVNAILAAEGEAIDLDNFTVKDFEELKKKDAKIIPIIAERIKCLIVNYVRTYIEPKLC